MRADDAPAASIATLVSRAGEGDQSAWNAIVARFDRLVWATARAHRLATSDAADVCQTTWLRLVENLDRIREPERLGAWLVTTARRECLRMIRLRGRELTTDETTPFERPDEDLVSTQVITRERDNSLLRALAALDERCRMLLTLVSAVDPPSYEQIGTALGMPVGAIGPTRARCLDKLRRQPALRGLELA